MEYYEEYLIKALSCSLNNKSFENPVKEIDYIKLFKKAQDHKIHPLIFPYIEAITGDYAPSAEFLDDWRNLNILSGFNMVRLEGIVDRIIKEFEKVEVDLILLKGAVLKDLYPKKELRTMGDIDIIVKEDDIEKVKRIFNSFSYATDYDSHGNILFVKEKNIKYEVFYSLENVDNIWEKVVNIDEYKHIYRLSNEAMLFHLVSHLAKHIKYRGAGIRNLCDIYLLIENWSFDENLVFKMLKEKGFFYFFTVLLTLLNIYFGSVSKFKSIKGSETEAANELMEFMLKYGVYGIGYDENVFYKSARSFENKGSIEKIKAFLEVIFPPADKLSEKYAYAKKYPVLIVFAWIHRIFSKRFSEKITVSGSIDNMKKANSSINLQQDIISKLKL